MKEKENLVKLKLIVYVDKVQLCVGSPSVQLYQCGTLEQVHGSLVWEPEERDSLPCTFSHKHFNISWNRTCDKPFVQSKDQSVQQITF